MIRVLFVCLGNICRSPLSQGVFEEVVRRKGLSEHVEADSAGTHGFYHAGEPPDPRAQKSARRRGIDISNQRARLLDREDCETFDYVLTMDEENYERVSALCRSDGAGASSARSWTSPPAAVNARSPIRTTVVPRASSSSWTWSRRRLKDYWRTSGNGTWAGCATSDRIPVEGVEAALGERLVSARPLGGGCIGEVYRAELADGSAVVAKVDRTGEANLGRESYMLRYLREKSELPVPEVYHSSEHLLLMQFMQGGGDFSRAEGHAARLLAALHDITADAYGHERDTLIGSLSQPNPWTPSWIDFFREQRLLYAARVAREAGRLPAEIHRRVESLAARLDGIIGEPNQPSLIHGDVWSGNVLAVGDRVSAFLDPAIYHADPEIELAYISLFNSFGPRFFERYAEERGIRAGFFEERRHLYALYPLLVHVYYFGGGYVNSVDSTLRRFRS